MMGQRDERKWKEGAGYRSTVGISAQASDGSLRTYGVFNGSAKEGLSGDMHSESTTITYSGA
jgi:hypothetical protein